MMGYPVSQWGGEPRTANPQAITIPVGSTEGRAGDSEHLGDSEFELERDGGYYVYVACADLRFAWPEPSGDDYLYQDGDEHLELYGFAAGWRCNWNSGE